jgi:6-phosphogluconolactonase (cycloisomerase 2 family)
VNLAFMGANDGYWQVRYEDGYRTLVSYKSPSDPVRSWALKTIQFRDLRPPRPECQLLGEQYGQNDAEDGHYFSYQVTRAGARDSWVAGTGLAAGSALSGLVGFEFDSVVPTCRVPPVTDLFHWGGGSEAADTVRYRACSGSEVFDAGSLFFAWGLDSFRDPEYSPPLWPPPPRAVPALGRFMRRAIGDMLIRHPPFQVAGAVKVLRSGLRIAPGVLRSKLRIAPGVPGAAVSVRAVAYDSLLSPRAIGRIAFRTADTWRLRIPPSAAALEVTVTVRTGLVRDSAQYLLIPGAGGGVRAVTGVSCDGSHARVLTPAFGGERQSPLRVQFALRGPVRVTVGHRLFGVRRSRGTLEIPASAAACGPVSVVVAGRGHRKFRLAAVDVCEAVSARASRAPARPQLFGVAGSPFATGRRPEAVAFSPDGRLLASADSIDNAVSVFAVAPSVSRLQGSPLTTGSLPSAVAFSPDGALLAVTNYGGDTVSVYAVAATGTMSQVPGSPFATGGYSTSVGFSPDGQLVATADSEDFTTSVFTVAPGGRVSRANGSPFATGAQPQSLAFAPSGRLLAVANYVGETVSLFTVGPDGELTPAPGSPLPIGAHPESLAFNPASGVLAVAATDGSRTFVHQFSAAPGAGPRELPGSPYRVTGDNYAQSLAFSPDGQLLADANANVGTVSVFEVGPAAGLSEIAGSPYPIGRSAWPLSVSFGRFGRLLATANFGGNSISMFTTSPPTVAAIRVSLGQGLAPHGPRAPIRALLKYSGYPITVTALRAGRLTIGWYARGGVRVAGATTGFYGAGTKTIKIGLTAAGRRLLAKAGRMKLRVRASFDPYGAGVAVTTERRITLRRRAQG